MLQERLADDPNDAALWRDLGLALLQRVRETADSSLYDLAQEAFDRATELAPADTLVLVGIGGLQLARHEFEEALETAETALAMAPTSSPAKAIQVDALVETGRYEEAVTATEELLALGVDLSSLARASYLRELHGNLEGALAAMQQAAQLPALAPENTAFVTTITGNLLALLDRRDEARDAYEDALEIVPITRPPWSVSAGLSVAAGDLPLRSAGSSGRRRSCRCPSTSSRWARRRRRTSGEDAARDSYDLARLLTQLFESNGVDVDVDLALFEADHGDPATALRLATKAYQKRQTIRTADALAWASHRSGMTDDASRLSAEALRLDTRDPLLLYHGGIASLQQPATPRRPCAC